MRPRGEGAPALGRALRLFVYLYLGRARGPGSPGEARLWAWTRTSCLSGILERRDAYVGGARRVEKADVMDPSEEMKERKNTDADAISKLRHRGEGGRGTLDFILGELERRLKERRAISRGSNTLVSLHIPTSGRATRDAG